MNLIIKPIHWTNLLINMFYYWFMWSRLTKIPTRKIGSYQTNSVTLETCIQVDDSVRELIYEHSIIVYLPFPR